MSRAPDFSGNYPSAGEIIGPAWQELWDLMEDGHPRSFRQAHEDLTKRGHVIEPVTVRNLLKGARKAELLTVRMRKALAHNGMRAKTGFYSRMDLTGKSGE